MGCNCVNGVYYSPRLTFYLGHLSEHGSVAVLSFGEEAERMDRLVLPAAIMGVALECGQLNDWNVALE